MNSPRAKPWRRSCDPDSTTLSTRTAASTADARLSARTDRHATATPLTSVASQDVDELPHLRNLEQTSLHTMARLEEKRRAAVLKHDHRGQDRHDGRETHRGHRSQDDVHRSFPTHARDAFTAAATKAIAVARPAGWSPVSSRGVRPGPSRRRRGVVRRKLPLFFLSATPQSRGDTQRLPPGLVHVGGGRRVPVHQVPLH
jgi:hypothetical protein